jgi:muramoyltetrapeptide carboxypeptidase
MTSLARPPALRPGDRVAVLCVSGPVDQDRLATGLAALRSAGLEPVTYPSAHDPGTMRPYLAGDDAMRAADLRSALTDPDVSGVIFARGGYGAQRTLEVMDWTGIDSAGSEKPKILVGFSDVTAMLEAVAARLGWASVHGPVLTQDSGSCHPPFGQLIDMLTAPQRATCLRFPESSAITTGTARGVTCGGNLTMLAASLGTATSWPASGGIWLVEEVNEAPYRVDRLLTQLRRSGYLDGVAGIVAGTFTGCGDPSLILAERLGGLGVPMITGANVGHGDGTQPFPIGIAAELDADAGTLRLLDPPLEP